MEIFKVIASIVCIFMTDSGWANLARERRGVHLTVPKGSGNSAAVASAVRSLNTKMDKQNEALNRLADATELATKTVPRSCIMTDKYGYTRIQLEPTSKPFDVFCEQAIDEGGWTLILQRFNGTSRNAQEYRNGYNSIRAGEYFLGTDKLYALTHSRKHELIFVMEFNNFVLQNPEAYSLWAQEHETRRYSWTQWQNDAARLQAEQSWISYEECQPGEALCGLERL
ncbi:fibrinogen beta chain-like [Drosophila tropicalis]|uniref:fibrinogen beta chain-like n=1 Tax=Drosophila tropicalis TaxID=46794 RepID=UPI0035ABD63A